MADAFRRLDTGAEPELILLCKHCLAPEKDDRPANGGAVAAEVAGLRAAADDRARKAELDRVRAEGERAKAEAETREQNKRRRVQLGVGGGRGAAAAGRRRGCLAASRARPSGARAIRTERRGSSEPA